MILEKLLKNPLEYFLTGILLGGSYTINEVVQQGKHFYYHVAGIKHKRMQKEDINSNTFFDNLSVYTRNN